MKNRWFLVGMIFLLVPLVTVGCGVAQEQYDAVVAERDSLAADLQSFQGELDAAKSEVQSVQSELEQAQAEVESAQAKNSELTSSLEKAESELQAGSAELTASVQTSQAELEAAQAKVSELTSSLEKVENELEITKSEYEAFKSEVESLLVLSLDQQLALQSASRDAQSASFDRDLKAFVSAASTVKGILADLIDVKADKLKSLWNDAYYMKTYVHEAMWGLQPGDFMDFTRLNNERIFTIKKVLSVY